MVPRIGRFAGNGFHTVKWMFVRPCSTQDQLCLHWSFSMQDVGFSEKCIKKQRQHLHTRWHGLQIQKSKPHALCNQKVTEKLSSMFDTIAMVWHC